MQTVEKRNASNAKVFRQIIFYLKDETHPEWETVIYIAVYWCPHYIKGESISLKNHHFNIPGGGENLTWI